jgi:hypothetical protein
MQQTSLGVGSDSLTVSVIYRPKASGVPTVVAGSGVLRLE